MSQNIGVFGLGVMGASLPKNIERNGTRSPRISILGAKFRGTFVPVGREAL